MGKSYRKPAPLNLTREEAEKLSSVLTYLNGKLQYQGAIAKRMGTRNKSFIFWNRLSKKVANTFGYDAFAVMDTQVKDLLYPEKIP